MTEQPEQTEVAQEQGPRDAVSGAGPQAGKEASVDGAQEAQPSDPQAEIVRIDRGDGVIQEMTRSDLVALIDARDAIERGKQTTAQAQELIDYITGLPPEHKRVLAQAMYQPDQFVQRTQQMHDDEFEPAQRSSIPAELQKELAELRSFVNEQRQEAQQRSLSSRVDSALGQFNIFQETATSKDPRLAKARDIARRNILKEASLDPTANVAQLAATYARDLAAMLQPAEPRDVRGRTEAPPKLAKPTAKELLDGTAAERLRDHLNRQAERRALGF